MRSVSLGAAICLVAAGGAQADPCIAPVVNYRPGAVLSGLVRYVADGDSICIGASSDPHTWIEIRLADFDAPEISHAGGVQAKAKMQAIALGRPAMCKVTRGRNGRATSYDRVIAACRIEGRPLGSLMRSAGVEEGGR